TLWKEHLLNMDHLKEGIHLRGYAQKDPLNEYKREAFGLFDDLLTRIKAESIEVLARVEVRQPDEVERMETERAAARDRQLSMSHPTAGGMDEDAEDAQDPHTPFRREGDKVGRNSVCPCGSGKKYKYCCGKLS
ncbi:MAG: SEC-C domain-containing protein, partial [Magnetococcales bacterium]|nr:SEC-C domain-containing protein [Magnetococcales bacterium]